MIDGQTRLRELASMIELGRRPKGTTVRAVLKWFGAERRGVQVINQITRAMEQVGLGTEPDFASAGIDDRVAFVLVRMASPTSVDAIPSAEKACDIVVPVEVPTAENGADEIGAIEDDSEESPPGFSADEKPVICKQNDWNVAVLYDWYRKGDWISSPIFKGNTSGSPSQSYVPG